MATLTNDGLFYAQKLRSGIRVAQVVGLTTTAFLCGKTFSQSFSSTPALLKAPSASLLATQWKTMLDSDKALTPAIVLLGTSVFGYLAYREPRLSSAQLLYSTSATLLLSGIPYSLLALEPVNKKLEAKAASLGSVSLTEETGGAKKEEKEGEESVHALVDRWATVNLGRTVLIGLAALCTTWAAVEKFEVLPAAARVATGADRMGR